MAVGLTRTSSTELWPTASPAGAAMASADAQPQAVPSHLQVTGDAPVRPSTGLNAHAGYAFSANVFSNSEQADGGNPESCILTAHGGQSTAAAPLRQARAQPDKSSRGDRAPRLGSGVTAAAVAASKHSAIFGKGQFGGVAGGACPISPAPPVPSIADVRQLLGGALNQLLDAAKAEPQWLRGGERRFEGASWAKVIQAAQLMALR